MCKRCPLDLLPIVPISSQSHPYPLDPDPRHGLVIGIIVVLWIIISTVDIITWSMNKIEFFRENRNVGGKTKHRR
jgi:hypothetical protein